MDMKLMKRMRIRRKFRHIIRQVLNNRYWMQETSDTQLGDNVKQNIALIYQKKKADKGGLTFYDKCIMRKTPEQRTDAEIDLLYNSIGGMKCFRLWPEDVKYQLVCSTHFVYYGPGRTLIKQNMLAQGLYFIVTGEIEMLQTYFDEVTQEWATQLTGKLGPGTMFGEVSLLKKLPFLSTLRTLTHCELLRVDKDDFNETLSETLKEQWDEIKEGLLSFPYFRGLSDNAQTECCTLSTLKQFPAKQIIYSYQSKKYGNTYFILAGKCRIIEQMYIRERKIGHKTVYSVYKPSPELRIRRSINHPLVTKPSDFLDARKEDIKKEIYERCPTIFGLIKSFGMQNEENETLFETESSNSKYLPKDVKCHFIEVCALDRLSCYFENEIFDNRYLISETPMKILCIPTYWLYMNNRANIWNRLIIFLKNHIPSSDQVFKKFVEDRKWICYKKMMSKDALGKREDYITTLWSDVPYSLRITEVYKDINCEK